MSLKDLLKMRHDGEQQAGGESTCQTYVAEDWIMSDDLGYSGGDWACCEETISTGSNWMSIAGLTLGILALGTAIYAAFAPRNVVESTRQKVQSAASKAASKARETAESARETVEAHSGHHSSSSSAMGSMNCAPGL